MKVLTNTVVVVVVVIIVIITIIIISKSSTLLIFEYFDVTLTSDYFEDNYKLSNQSQIRSGQSGNPEVGEL